jgi:hypothetical protein
MKNNHDSLEKLPVRLRNRLERSRAGVGDLGFVLRGTLASYYTTCGKPSCRCQQDPADRHGPYFQWTTKVDGKTRTVRLKPDDIALYREAVANGQRLEKLIANWMAASMDALDLMRRRSRS